MSRLIPKSILGQLLLAVLVVLVVAQLTAIALIVGVRGMLLRFQQDEIVVSRTLRDIAELPSELPTDLPVTVNQRPNSGTSFLSGNNRASIVLEITRQSHLEETLRRRLREADLITEDATVFVIRHPRRRPTPEERNLIEGRATAEFYHPGVAPDRTGPSGPGMREVIASVEIAPGIWYNLMSPYYPAATITRRALGATALGALIGMGLISLLAYRITRPLRGLADAADGMGRGDMRQAEESGPSEVRRAAAAFNRMQDRIGRLLDTQIAMLRGVSHDLRMPIARLRLRAEEIADAAERERIISGLDEMTAMVGSIMQAARDVSSEEQPTDTDLGALAEAVVANFEEAGGAVEFAPPDERLVLRCRRMVLKRAIANLAANAVSYAGGARISLSRTGDEVRIEVEDEGPGIPDERMEEATEPFVRLVGEGAPEGAGLGLAIARAAAESHGGRLILSNRAEGGLRASMVLPA